MEITQAFKKIFLPPLKELKKAFSPLGKDKFFANLVLIFGIVVAMVQLSLTFALVYFYFYDIELFSRVTTLPGVHWYEHLINSVLAGATIWFGVYLRKRINKIEEENDGNIFL